MKCVFLFEETWWVKPVGDVKFKAEFKTGCMFLNNCSIIHTLLVLNWAKRLLKSTGVTQH